MVGRMASRQGIASGMIPSSTVWYDGQLLSRNFKSRLIFVVGTYEVIKNDYIGESSVATNRFRNSRFKNKRILGNTWITKFWNIKREMEFEYVHEKSRREESITLLKSLNLGDSVSSAVYLHVLDVIGAISCLSKKSKSKRSQIEVAEQKLFWKTLGEISSLHANQDGDEEKNPALSTVLQSFPKEKPTEDWLPLHFALSLKNIDLEINQALMIAQPNRIHTSIIATNLYWLDYKWTVPDNDFMFIDTVPAVKPCHLAFMRKEPCPGLIDQLFAFDAHFASSGGASDGSLPLHFAARYSNSVDLIRRLVDLYSTALRRKNKSGETPIYMIESNGTPAASEILTYFIEACPESLRRTNNLGNLPLHTFASNGCNPIDMINIALLIDAYPDALDRTNNGGKRPIELAAESASMEVFQVIVEREDPNRVDESVMHTAVGEGLIRNIEYLHSIKPELLINKLQGRTALQFAIETFGRRGNHGNLIRTVASLSPEALTMTDDRGNNLLHALLSDIFIMKCDDLVEDTMRFLLRFIPGGAIAMNNDGQTPLDVLHAKNNIMSRTMATQMVVALSSLGSAMRGEAVGSGTSSGAAGGDNEEEHVLLDSILFNLRRLLLIAGAPSLQPELRREMNYIARKDALFVFFADRRSVSEEEEENQNSSSSCSSSSGGRSSRVDIICRIRNGPGSMELMKQIVSFL